MSLPKNMGGADRITRVVIALIVAALILTNVVSGVLAIILGILAVIFVATSFISFCPIYMPFNLSTRGKQE